MPAGGFEAAEDDREETLREGWSRLYLCRNSFVNKNLVLLSPFSTAFNLSKVDLRVVELLGEGGRTAKKNRIITQVSKDCAKLNVKRIEECGLTSFPPDGVKARWTAHIKVLG